MPLNQINDSFLNNATNLFDITSSINDASGKIFITSLLLVIYIILFILFKNQGARVAMTGVSFIITIIASMAWFLKLISGYIVIIPIALLVLSIIGLYLLDD